MGSLNPFHRGDDQGTCVCVCLFVGVKACLCLHERVSVSSVLEGACLPLPSLLMDVDCLALEKTSGQTETAVPTGPWRGLEDIP